MNKKNKKQNRLAIMFEMQDDVNKKIDPDWKNSDNNWNTAIWTEAAEALDNVPWKWWRESSIKLDSAKVEIVDIFHFSISSVMKTKGLNIERLDKIISNMFFHLDSNGYIDVEELKSSIEEIAKGALNDEHPLSILLDVIRAAVISGMNYDELFKLYVGKNVLNKFRSDNGYANGTYLRTWNGIDDSYVMYSELKKIEKLKNLSKSLTKILEKKYKKAKKTSDNSSGKRELSGSEAIFGFVGWITTREERVAASTKDDASMWVDLVDKFCKENNLKEPGVDWSELLKHPVESKNMEIKK